MKHTPGPWRVARDVYGVLRVWGVAVDTDEEGETHRCEVDVATCCGDGSLTADEEQENAEFIAASPAIESERDSLRQRTADLERLLREIYDHGESFAVRRAVASALGIKD